ncbi:MAG TPA: DnaJ domain-containing protein [Vicinamibacteria bacterium]|nr:DnaJ domain-containing protein [Vicinamibacteria bacterium]
MTDYYAILGVPRTASTSEIRQAYARLARDKHPDRFADPAERAQAHDAFRDITTAFNALSNDKSRREYDQGLERPRPTGPVEIAREAYERAVQHMRANEFHEAVDLLRSAVHHAPQEARYRAALATALARNPRWVRDAIQEAEQAARLEPGVAEHHVLVAELLLSQGLRLRARRAAEAALRLSPDDPRARRVVEEAGS